MREWVHEATTSHKQAWMRCQAVVCSSDNCCGWQAQDPSNPPQSLSSLLAVWRRPLTELPCPTTLHQEPCNTNHASYSLVTPAISSVSGWKSSMESEDWNSLYTLSCPWVPSKQQTSPVSSQIGSPSFPRSRDSPPTTTHSPCPLATWFRVSWLMCCSGKPKPNPQLHVCSHGLE